MKVFSVAEMVAAEKAADAAGVSYERMMENAGKAVADAIQQKTNVAGLHVTILVGPGNNGGDGLVAARYLAQAGADVVCYLSRARDAGSDANYAQLQQIGLLTLVADLDQRYRVLRHRLHITDILVDALLGTGVSRPIGGDLAHLLRQVQVALQEHIHNLAQTHQPPLLPITHIPPPPPRPLVVAVDCPSGLNCDSGALDPLAIPADLTITFAGPKRGHFIFPGAAACGEIVVADIGISADLEPVLAAPLTLMTAAEARALLPPRPPDGHKGTFGTAIICAGQARYWGAPVLAGLAALRGGAGLVALGVPQAIRAAVATQLPEATYLPLPERTTLGADAARLLARDGVWKGRAALLLGPGLGKAEAFVSALLDTPDLPPLVIDADGLNMLAQMPDWPNRVPPGNILTPHPGELARLLGVSLPALLAQDRVTVTREAATRWGQVVVHKGAYTVIAAPDGRVALLPFAHAALSIGGSGDVLAGIIAALRAQDLPAFDAARLGGYLHGAAALRAAPGPAGLLTREIAHHVPRVIAALRVE